MDEERTVSLEDLGLCEHCGVLSVLEDMPFDISKAEYRCLRCGGPLTAKTFGYERVNGILQKVKWVGSDRKWTKTKPAGNFTLGGWNVVISMEPNK